MDYTIDTLRELSFDKLRTLHREIGALIAEKRVEALNSLRDQVALLGFSAEDLIPKKNGKGQAQKYRNPETAETWSGRGHRPQWVKDALDGGRQLEEFLIAS